MKPQIQNPWRNRFARPALTLVCVLTAATGLFAQTVLIAPPVIPVVDEAAVEPGGDTNQLDKLDSADALTPTGSPSSLANKNPFQYGPVTVHPHVGYSFTYGTGIQSQPGQPQKSAINSVSAGLGLDLGKRWQLGYTASAAFYGDTNFHNNVNHTFSLAGKTSYEDWTFNLSQIVALTSDPIVETAQQTDQQSYATAVGATRDLNNNFSLDLTANQNLRDVQGNTSIFQGYTNTLDSSRDWSTMAWLNYHWAPTLSTAVGMGFGYNSVSSGPDMTYEDFQGRINWQLARKFSLSLNGGAQVRQMLGTGLGSLVNPTFGASLGYHPFPVTSFHLTASRGIGASYFKNNVTVSTSVSVGVSQRLFKKIYLNVDGGYSQTAYQNSSTGLSGRDDKRSFLSAGLSTSFLKHGTASVHYSKSKNSVKNAFGYSYDSEQIGISLGFGY